MSYTKAGTAVSYAYDADGIRTRKTVGNVRHEYETEGGKVYRELIYNGNTLTFDLRYFYDAAGRPAMLQVISGSGGSSVYYYGTNAQGDVIAMYDSDGNLCVSYLYDAWGNLLSAKSYTNAGTTARSLNSFSTAVTISILRRGSIMYPAVITILRFVGGSMQMIQSISVLTVVH